MEKLDSGLVHEFRRVLAQAQKIAIVSHTDMDGMAATRALCRSSFGPKVSLVLGTDTSKRDLHDAQEAELLAAEPDLVVFLDLPPSNLPQLARILSGRRGVIVDHHRAPDYEGIPELNTRFLSYRLFKDSPDKYSIGILLPELLGEPYEHEFAAAALIGDGNFEHFKNLPALTTQQLEDARFVGRAYKVLGCLQTLRVEDVGLAAEIQRLTQALALEANDLHDLRRKLASNQLTRDILAGIQRDQAALIAQATRLVADRLEDRQLVSKFSASSGFLVTGFVYILEERIRSACPGFRGLLLTVQEADHYWKLDGVSTDPALSVGKLFSFGGIGGGHHSVGGGTIEKASGLTPESWFQTASCRTGVR